MGGGDLFSILSVLHCLKSRLWKYIVSFGTQQLVVVSWESSDGKQRLSGTLGGDDVFVKLALPVACQFVSGLSFSCPHPPWQSKRHSTNVTAGHQPFVVCVCLSNEGMFVPKHPASLLIEFSLSHTCVSAWVSSRYNWHCLTLPLEKSPNIRILHPSFILLFFAFPFSYAIERCFRSHQIVLIHVLLLPSWSMQKSSKCSGMAYLLPVNTI